MIGFNEIKFSVSGHKPRPVSIPCSPAKEEFNLYSGEFYFSLPVITTQTPAVADLLPCLEKLHQSLALFVYIYSELMLLYLLDISSSLGSIVYAYNNLSVNRTSKSITGLSNSSLKF